MSKQFVRCCDTTKQNDMIYFFEEKDATGFCYNADDVYIEYCPWCGVLLDWNLPMTDEHP
jgi:hypothetical protein